MTNNGIIHDINQYQWSVMSHCWWKISNLDICQSVRDLANYSEQWIYVSIDKKVVLDEWNRKITICFLYFLPFLNILVNVGAIWLLFRTRSTSTSDRDLKHMDLNNFKTLVSRFSHPIWADPAIFPITESKESIFNIDKSTDHELKSPLTTADDVIKSDYFIIFDKNFSLDG